MSRRAALASRRRRWFGRWPNGVLVPVWQSNATSVAQWRANVWLATPQHDRVQTRPLRRVCTRKRQWINGKLYDVHTWEWR